MKAIALFICVFFIGEARAGRVVDVIPFRLDASWDFRKNFAGEWNIPANPPSGPQDPPTVAGGPRVAGRITLFAQLINLSSIQQTGTFELITGTNGVRAYAMQDYETVKRYLLTTIIFCGIGGGSHSHNSGSTAENQTELPAPSRWTIGPGETGLLHVHVVYTGNYGETAASGGVNLIEGVFQPAFRIKVNEGRGAVLGSISAKFWSIGQSGTITFCSGKTFDSAYAGYLQSSTPTVPILINGGRPF